MVVAVVVFNLKTNKIMTKITIFILCLLMILVCSCKLPKDKFCYEDYTIQSIRIDDDSEYHILTINSRGKVLALHDCDDDCDIYIHYQKISKPILRIEYIKSWINKKWVMDTDGYPQVILPFNYSISTFDD